jgi:hypothetical protein
MTTIDGIEWIDCEAGASEQALAELESRIGQRLPDDYRRFVQTCEGGSPTTRMRVRYRSGGREFITSLGAMLKVAAEASDGIIRKMQRLSVDGQLPPDVIPIGEVGDGDLFAFHYQNGTASVVLWLHTENEDEAIVPIASSFTDFLSKLEARPT